MDNLQENLQYIDDYDKEFIQLLTGKKKLFLLISLIFQILIIYPKK